MIKTKSRMQAHFHSLEHRKLLSVVTPTDDTGHGGSCPCFSCGATITPPDASNTYMPLDSVIPVSTTGPGDRFDIDIVFSGSITPDIEAAFNAAKALWENILLGDIPDVFVSGIGWVDDLRIEASVVPIDGPGGVLGSAGPDRFRSGSLLPITGTMRFDSADVPGLIANGRFTDVVVHEMGHVLGVGTLWSYKNLLAGSTTDNPRFLGANATAEYQKLVRTSVSSVPVENTGGGGTRNAHWRETVYNNELMTGYLNSGANPMSRITAASMIDLGYPNVNVDGAALYTVPGGNDLPSVGTLGASPNPTSGPVTLRLSSATDSDGVSRVDFFREANNRSNLQSNIDVSDELVGSAFSAGTDGAWTLTLPAGSLIDGSSTYYARAVDSRGAFSAVRLTTHVFNADTTPPTVLGSSHEFETRQAVKMTFSEPVVGAAAGDLVVTNLSTGQTLPGSRFSLGADSTDTVKVWQYDTAAHGPMPDGNYLATLPAGSVSDAAGNALASDAQIGFYHLGGDANRDRAVNLVDMAILRANFGMAGRTFSQGDFNYDGTVNLMDLAVLRGNFGVSLPAPGGSLFGDGGAGDGGGGGGVLS